MNILPAVVIVCCGTFAGVAKSRSLKKRTEFLGECIKMTEEFSVRIRYGSENISSIIRALNTEGGYKTLSFLCDVKSEDFFPEWEEAIKKLPIPKEDSAILLDLGRRLGGSDLQGQLMMLESIHIRLKKNLETAEKDYSEKGRMFRSTGMLCGLACGIVVL